MVIPKVFKKKWFWLLIVFLIVIIGYLIFRPHNNASAYTTQAVARGDLKQTVTATGVVESAAEMNLNFKNSGWLRKLNVKVGDQVKAGQILAQQQNSTQSAAVSNARAALLAAQANLTKVLAGTAAEDLQVYEQNVLREQTNLTTLQNKQAQELDGLRDKLADSLNNAVFGASISLNTVYENLINPNNVTNLNVGQSAVYNQIPAEYNSLVTELGSAKQLVERANADKSESNLLPAVEAVKGVLDKLTTLLNNSFVVSDSIFVNATYTQDKKDSIKASLTSQQTSNNTNLNSLQTAKTSLINTQADYENRIQTQQATLAYAQAQLAQKQAPAKQYDVDYYRAQVEQARANLVSADANLEDTYLKAPVDGIITQKNNEVGEQTSLTQPVLVMMADSNLQIEVNIPESDIAKISLEQDCDITLDAFGDDRVFQGKVYFIDPAATKISDVVYYKTKVVLAEKNSDIKAGMTANLTIKTAQKSGVLLTQQRAVKIKEGKRYVEVLVNNQPQQRDVTLGLWGDEGLVEVLTGLQEGEPVITYTKTESK
jgi:HlyD family secretion protein